MENTKQVGGSSSSITMDLFGPKGSSSSSSSSSSLSSGIFSSIFQPPSSVPGRNPSHTASIGSHRKQGSGNQRENGKHGTSDSIAQICNGESSVDRSSIYHNETVEPCYFSSSIYYGGQEVYSPNARKTESHPIVKKDGGDDDNGSNSNSASRGNWWQGMNLLGNVKIVDSEETAIEMLTTSNSVCVCECVQGHFITKTLPALDAWHVKCSSAK